MLTRVLPELCRTDWPKRAAVVGQDAEAAPFRGGAACPGPGRSRARRRWLSGRRATRTAGRRPGRRRSVRRGAARPRRAASSGQQRRGRAPGRYWRACRTSAGAAPSARLSTRTSAWAGTSSSASHSCFLGGPLVPVGFVGVAVPGQGPAAPVRVRGNRPRSPRPGRGGRPPRRRPRLPPGRFRPGGWCGCRRRSARAQSQLTHSAGLAAVQRAPARSRRSVRCRPRARSSRGRCPQGGRARPCGARGAVPPVRSPGWSCLRRSVRRWR